MTLTTEQLKTRIEALRNSASGIASTFSADADALEELLRYREAQPVAELVYSSAMPRFIGDTNEVEGYRCWIHGETRLVPTMEQAYADAKAVCTTPPAPAVPPEATPENIENLLADITLFFTAGSLSHGGSVIFAEVWNACRAAMLAQPVISGYKLPDGFKLMPLEMTDEIGEAIAMEARCCGGIALCIYESALAAAPEGGNDHDTRR